MSHLPIAFPNASPVAEQHCLEFVHHHQRQEPAPVETAAHPACYALPQSGLHGIRACRSGSPRPCARPVLRQPVIVHHQRYCSFPILPEMKFEVLARRGPGANTAAPGALPSIPQQPCAGLDIAEVPKMGSQHLVDKIFLCLAFDENEQPRHVIRSPRLRGPGGRRSGSSPKADRGCSPPAIRAAARPPDG